jgi:plastocyanin
MSRRALPSLLVISALALAACGDGEDVPGPDPTFAGVALTPSPVPAIDVGETVQLTATPVDEDGNALSGLPAATFESSDDAIATVSETGLVTGVTAGDATITATVTFEGVTRNASATLTVNPVEQPGGDNVVTTPNLTFSPATITIAPGEAVTWQISETTHNVTFAALEPTGGDIPNTAPGTSVTRTFQSPGSYPYECTLHPGMNGTVIVEGTQPPPGGTTTVTTPNLSFSPQSVTITAGGTVTWRFVETPHNVTFGGAAPTEGNVPTSNPGTSATRTFPTAGQFPYECTLHPGMTGTVVVNTPGGAPPPPSGRRDAGGG